MVGDSPHIQIWRSYIACSLHLLVVRVMRWFPTKTTSGYQSTSLFLQICIHESTIDVSMHPSIPPSAHPFNHLSIHSSIFPSIHLLLIHLSIHLSIRLSIHSPVHLPIIYLCLSIMCLFLIHLSPILIIYKALSKTHSLPISPSTIYYPPSSDPSSIS